MRLHDLNRFYGLMTRLENKIGGAKFLADCNGHMNWPERGVYFFQEVGEHRSDSGVGPRIVRIGTHALKAGARTTLWSRLRTHRGNANLKGGNHRASIFRLIVGTAFIKRNQLEYPDWGKGNNASRRVRDSERPLESKVCNAIGRNMPFLWLSIGDEPGPDSQRGYIERNAISLLSNFDGPRLDLPSQNWLGYSCNKERVQKSCLWNQKNVDERYDLAFLDTLELKVDQME